MKASIDGAEFDLPEWTVKQRGEFLGEFNRAPKIADLTKPTPEELQAQQDFAVDWLARALGKDKAYIEGLKARTFDQLFTEIIKANRGPLPQLGP